MNARHAPELEKLALEAAEAFLRMDDDATQSLLSRMISLAPHRLDLRFDLGNHCIQIGRPDKSIAVFSDIVDDYPRDPDALFILAHWLRHAGRIDEARTLLDRLEAVRPERAADLEKVWNVVDGRLAVSPSDRLPDSIPDAGRPAILTLGFILNPDGSMGRELADRLEKTLEAAEKFPEADVVLSGGVPRAGNVEARVMRDWLVERGVSESRLHEESRSRDVVENMFYSRQILDVLKPGAVLVVTGADAVRRAGAALEIIGWIGGSAWRTPPAVAASGESFADYRDDGGDAFRLYRDALRAYGTSMMRTYPGLVRL